MGEIYFDIAAAIILLLDIFLFYYKKHLFSLQTRLFEILLWTSLFATSTDLLTALFNARPQRYPLWFLYASNGLFFVSLNSVPFLFSLYVLAMTGRLQCMSTRALAAFTAPVAAVYIAIFSTPCLKTVFYFDETRAYKHGPALAVLYLIAFLYIVFAVVCTTRYRRAMPERTVFAVYSFVFVSLVPAAVQFCCPHMLIQCLGIAVSELLILQSVQNPAEFIDSATGLFNRSGFVYGANLLRANRTPFHVILFVVEHMTFVKRNFGLAFSERLTGEIASYLSRETSANRFAAFLGEGRFALAIHEGRGDSGIRKTLAALQERFRTPWTVAGTSISLSVRICELLSPEEIWNVSEIFLCLEQLSLASKAWPKGRILHIGDMELANRKRETDVERAIRRALAKKTLAVYYQPVFSVDEQRIVAAEALVRLNDPELGFIPPDEFIPISERNGTILEIGSFVLTSACEFIRDQDLAGKGVRFVEINLSMVQCIQRSLPREILNTVHACGIRSEQVCLEITETAAAGSPDLLKHNLKTMAGDGFSFALDDFGTGYSNINSLMELPIAFVKIDRSMVQGWFESEKGKIILESSIALFKRMRLGIIAEGVETAEQVRTMTELGCDHLQGYYFSRPIPGPELIELLALRGKGDFGCT